MTNSTSPAGLIIFVVLLAAAILTASLGPQVWRYVRNKSLLSSGIEAPARIVEVIDTGNRINYNPQLRFKLEVQPEAGEAFSAEATAVISVADVHKLRPGASLRVKYDPDRPSTVAIIKQ